MTRMLPPPPASLWAQAPVELGMRDGFGLDDLAFWIGLVGGALGALVAVATLGALVLKPIREANARERRDAARREQLHADLYGSEARPGHPAEPGFLVDVRGLKTTVTQLHTDVGELKTDMGDLKADLTIVKAAAAQLQRNGGSHLADRVDRIARALGIEENPNPKR